MDGWTKAEVARIPACDFCAQSGVDTPAEYDGKTDMGPWAYMCAAHFCKYGVGVGLGYGQRLVEV
jgi:hypothetical protein